MSEHLLHCDKDADFQNCLCVEEEVDRLTILVKAADALAKAGNNIEDILEVPELLGASAQVTIAKAIESFRDAIAAYEKVRKCQ